MYININGLGLASSGLDLDVAGLFNITAEINDLKRANSCMIANAFVEPSRMLFAPFGLIISESEKPEIKRPVNFTRAVASSLNQWRSYLAHRDIG
jgi:hypothetical protein